MDDHENNEPEKSKTFLSSRWWWLLFAVILVWNLWMLMPRGSNQAQLPYSDFVQQVQSGNVASVDINGSQITGKFVQPINWSDPNQTNSQGQAAAPQKYAEFTTNFPEVVGDTGLMNMLEAHKVQVSVAPPASPLFSILLTYGLPFLLIIGVLFWLSRSATKSQGGMFNFGNSKARQYNPEMTKVTFNDVSGEDEAKEELQEVVDFLRHPQKYHDVGARVPRGVLLVGPPGTGKTLLARAVAGEAGVPFFTISASEFVEMFVGVGASRVRDLFERAKETAPAIIFIDELDAVGRRRGAGVGNVNDEREQTLNQLLVEMDGFDERHEVILLAATNRPDVLDPALLRPGRFDRQVTVGLPDRRGREGILKIHTRNLRLAPDVNLGLLSKTTTGFSGADLANLSNEAALIAARNDRKEVKMEDFEAALDRVLLGAARAILLNDHDRKVVAYHEAGHALVAWFTPFADPVHKVTIMPRGRALGVTEQLPGDDRYNYSRRYILARLAVMLGGRGAEDLVLGDITTGAENDLVEATRLARRMITRWGMGKLGLMAVDGNEEQPFLGYEMTQGREYSEETAGAIDHNVQDLLAEQYRNVKDLLSRSRDRLDNLVQALLQEETLDQDALEAILGPRNFDSELVPIGAQFDTVENA